MVFLISTQNELVESKNRSRTLELSSFSCLNLMHAFEILTKFKLLVTFEILFEYDEFALGNRTLHGEKIMEHECEV
jgi:hypothetical protein